MKAALVLVAGAVAAFAAVGPANAEAVDLTGDQLDQVTAGTSIMGPPPLTLAVFKNVAIQKLKNIKINAELKSVPYVRGNLAEAEAGANAYGKHTFSESLTITEVAQGYYSKSFSESVSATDGAKYHKP